MLELLGWNYFPILLNNVSASAVIILASLVS